MKRLLIPARTHSLIIIVVWILACSVSGVQAQLLYKISGNSISRPSYLMATNRLCDLALLDSVPNLFSAFGRCRKVVTEFTMQDYEAIAALRTAALLPDSVQLRKYYTEDEYREIDEALNLSLGLPLKQLARMKPAYLTEMYRTALFKQWLEYDEQQSMESFFQALAEERGMPVVGLDDIGETMFMLFDREPLYYQCDELLRVVRYPERETAQERIILNLYRNGRLTDIAYSIIAPDNRSSISYSDYQVYKARNKEWVKRLRPILLDGDAFIVLDAIYLGGDDGLIHALRNAGYKVKPVNR